MKKSLRVPKEYIDKMFSILFINDSKDISPESIQKARDYVLETKLLKFQKETMLWGIVQETIAYKNRLKKDFKARGEKFSTKEFLKSSEVIK